MKHEIGYGSKGIHFLEKAAAVSVDIAGEVLFGQSLNVQQTLSKTGRSPEWAECLMNVLMKTWSDFYMTPIYYSWPWLFRFLEPKRFKIYQNANTVIEDFLWNMVETRMKVKDGSQVTIEKRKKLVVIDSMIDLLESGQISKSDMLAELKLFILAGYDTTSNAMGLAIQTTFKN